MKHLRLIFTYCIISAMLLSCHASYYKVKITKPKKHYGHFDNSKDAKKKRIKTVKYKSLKSTKGIDDKD